MKSKLHPTRNKLRGKIRRKAIDLLAASLATLLLKLRPSSLLKRFATTEEVANLVTYVCSPQSAATNGAAFRVDGGVVQTCF
jgi:NAD(P)-dependent dehydrogenase (short-subunit alcohol dehydrogenase family)